MNEIETKLSEYQEVPGFECPAEFWPALGYEEKARYVAIYWEQCGDEASWADGRDALCGADWPSYLALLDHNFSVGHAARWWLGGSDTEATHWLIIDRETERAWLVPAAEASQVLHLQWPVYEVAPLPADSMVEWLARWQSEAARQVRPPAMVDIERVMAQQHERYGALRAALDGRKVAKFSSLGGE